MKKKVDPRQYLNKFYQDRRYLDLFIKTKNRNLPSFQKSGIDHEIDLEKINKKNPEIPWRLLYNMSWKELLMLRKELIKLLNKDFI